MNALLVCHAGAGLGLGHLSRALVVAATLRDQFGANVHLLIQGDSVQRADLNTFQHQFIEFEVDLLATTRKHIHKHTADVVVFDLHPRYVPTDMGVFLEDVRYDGVKVISVDCLVHHQYNLDLVFIPSFRFSPLNELRGLAPVRFGWDCYLLNVHRRPVPWKPGRKVLTLSGGSDATGLGKTLPTLLHNTLPAETELHWVTGPYAPQPIWPVTPHFTMVNHQSPAGLDDLMVNINYAVTPYGVSFFELLYYGVPTVVFSPYGNKDDAELSEIAVEGVALVAKDEVEAVAMLKSLMADDTLATSLSLQARRKLSVAGAQTLVQSIAALVV